MTTHTADVGSRAATTALLNESRVRAGAVDVRARIAITAVLGGAVVGMLVSGFWNVRAVDGLGLALFVTPFIDPFEDKAAEFALHGRLFGVWFALLAGLAATITASNIAGFSMLPVLLLTNARAERPASPRRLLAVMACGVGAVGVLYGAFYGRLGPDGATAFHTGAIRSAQSFTVFSALGGLLVVWALVQADLASRLTRSASLALRQAMTEPMVVAALAGTIIGLFSIGRPLAVFRQALLYAAQPASVPYAALIGGVAALATLAGFALVLTVVTRAADRRLRALARERPGQADLLAAAALAGGGTFLIFYWALSRVWPALGRWGFALGWYA